MKLSALRFFRVGASKPGVKLLGVKISGKTMESLGDPTHIWYKNLGNCLVHSTVFACMHSCVSFGVWARAPFLAHGFLPAKQVKQFQILRVERYAWADPSTMYCARIEVLGFGHALTMQEGLFEQSNPKHEAWANHLNIVLPHPNPQTREAH